MNDLGKHHMFHYSSCFTMVTIVILLIAGETFMGLFRDEHLIINNHKTVTKYWSVILKKLLVCLIYCWYSAAGVTR